MWLHRAATCVLAVVSLSSIACTVERDEPNLEGQDVSLTIMHTSDIHSRFLPYFFAPGQIDKGLGLIPPPGQTTALVGGISRISSILKCARGIYGPPFCDSLYDTIGQPASRSIHVDSGDIFQGAPIFNVFSGELEMRAMSQVGLTAMVIANHEFDKGAVNLFTQWQRFGGFPMLAANYMFADPRDYTQNKLGLIVPPYIIVNVGGLKVGLIGMANLSSIQGLIEGGNSLGIRPIPEEQALSFAVQVLRPQVDVLAVVSHLGLEEDEGVAISDTNLSQDEALALQGIDLIMGGHLHVVLNPPKDLPRMDPQTGALLGHTVLCHSGAFAKYVGRLDLVVHVPSKAEREAGERGGVKSYVYRVIPVNEDVPEDPDLVRLIEPYQLQMNRRLNLTQVFALIPCERTQTGNCPKVVRNAPEGGDSQLGNLVATAMRLRRRVEADFALTNSLGIRADFESGPLDLEQMYNVFPFENTIATMFLSGVEVKQMLDFVAARSSERGCRAQAQVSGIYFDMVCARGDVECCAPDDAACMSGASPAHPCAKNIYLGDACRKPDGSIDETRCRPLDPFALYRVAVNDYIANGGSGFSVLKRNTTKFNTGISLRDALIDYVRTLPGTCDTTQYGNVVGVSCRDEHGKKYDCTKTCCCHDEESGPVACSTKCAAFEACKTASPPKSPETYDYSTSACLVPGGIEASDGRIRPITVVR
jgi:5'-nucleotidase